MLVILTVPLCFFLSPDTWSFTSFLCPLTPSVSCRVNAFTQTHKPVPHQATHARHITYTWMKHWWQYPHPCFSCLSPLSLLCLCLSSRPHWSFFFSFLFGLPQLLTSLTNHKGYINVDNQFLYVSSQSWGKTKKEKKKSKVFYSIVQMCFYYF